MGLATRLIDINAAYEGNTVKRRIDWWLRGRRPSRLHAFSEEAVRACREFRPDYLITTGLAPLSAQALAECRRLAGMRINFLTDDPWNPAHRAPWFFESLIHYDWVFSPRMANLEQLRAAGPAKVEYLPFGYARDLHYPEAPSSDEEAQQIACDLLFAGGADADRTPWITGALDRGMKVALYGGYWDRYGKTAAHARGDAKPRTLRVATGAAKVVLCLVRRANRDGHAMRSFETPAMRGCMIAERTAEHVQLFGEDGEAVLYADQPGEIVDKVYWLLSRPEERQRLAAAAHCRITHSGNSYHDRLMTMLSRAGGAPLE
jgi:spore maturation protein CgeB